MEIKITENKFITIKSMLQGGATVSMINRVIGASTCTIYRIKKAKDFEEYKAMTKSSLNFRKEKKDSQDIKDIEEQTVPHIGLMYAVNRLYEETKKQTALLERIVAAWKA